MGSKFFRNASTFVSRSAVTFSKAHAETLFSRLAKISAVPLVEVCENVGDNQPNDPADQHPVRPGIDKSGGRTTAVAAKQRRTFGVFVF